VNTFIQGKELCRGFFRDAAEPILRRFFPDLLCRAAPVGSFSQMGGLSEFSDDPDRFGAIAEFYKKRIRYPGS